MHLHRKWHKQAWLGRKPRKNKISKASELILKKRDELKSKLSKNKVRLIKPELSMCA